MRAVLAHRSAGGSSTGGGVPVTRIQHNFVDDAVTADLEARALDSGGGYTWRTDPTNAAAVGKVAADSTGRKGYVNQNTTVATTQDSHVIASPPLPTSAFYGRMTYHVDFAGTGSTNDWRVGGGIPWFDPLGTGGQGPKSACHTSMVQAGMFLQEFDVDDPDNVIQQDTVTYASPITDSRDLTVEWVISAADDAVVCKAPDGSYLSLETTNVSSWLMNWVDFEIGCKSTDKRVYCTEAAADWLDDHTDSSVIDRANSILAASGLGYGPIVKPAAAPDVVSSGVVRGATTIALGTHKAGDYILAFGYRIGSTANLTIPAGWTELTNSPGAANSGNMRVAYKHAASSSETFGTWTSATAVGYVVLDDTAGFNMAAIGTGSSATFTYPALTLSNHDGRSRVIRIGGHVNAQQTSSTPSGYTTLGEAMTVFGGGVTVMIDTARGVGTNPTSATQTLAGTGGAGWLCASIEVIPT